MKPTYIVPALLLSVALMAAGYFIGNMHKTGKMYDRFVQVKGLSEREVKADLAVWPLHISLTANNLRTLKQEIESQNAIVLDFLEDQGFGKEQVTKGSVSIQDLLADPYRSQQGRGEFRYLAKAEYTVRTREISQLQEALSASLELMSEGVIIGSKNTWRPVEYIFTGLNEIKPSMIEEATKNARAVAQKFARDSDSKVGGIREARQGLFTISDRDQNTPQIKKVRVVSTLEFQLED